MDNFHLDQYMAAEIGVARSRDCAEGYMESVLTKSWVQGVGTRAGK